MKNPDLFAVYRAVHYGLPIPVDVQARLLEVGVDVDAVVARLTNIKTMEQPK
jgi:hypothetical protein